MLITAAGLLQTRPAILTLMLPHSTTLEGYRRVGALPYPTTVERYRKVGALPYPTTVERYRRVGVNNAGMILIVCKIKKRNSLLRSLQKEMKLPSTARQLSSSTQNCQNDNNTESLVVVGNHWEEVISYL